MATSWMFFKQLGFTLDKKLTWNSHITNTCTRLAHVTFLLRRLKPMIPKNYQITVYHALFHSNVMYGLELWGHVSGSDNILILKKKAYISPTLLERRIIVSLFLLSWVF